MSVFYDDIEKITTENNEFRRILTTTPTMQLVLMSLAPKQEIGMETHPHATQFVRVENGYGLAIINGNLYALANDIAVIIPPNTPHNIINTSPEIPLKLYTIYSPPQH